MAETKIWIPSKAPRSFLEKDVKEICNDIINAIGTIKFSYQYKGRLCFFFDMNKKGNEITENGFIAGTGAPNQVAPKFTKQPYIVSVFATENGGKDYTYIGDVNYLAYYDDDRNILLWG